MNIQVDTSSYNTIGQMSLQESRLAGVAIVDESKMKHSTKCRLIRDLEKASKSTEVERILWMAALSAEGLSSMDSTWNK